MDFRGPHSERQDRLLRDATPSQAVGPPSIPIVVSRPLALPLYYIRIYIPVLDLVKGWGCICNTNTTFNQRYRLALSRRRGFEPAIFPYGGVALPA